MWKYERARDQPKPSAAETTLGGNFCIGAWFVEPRVNTVSRNGTTIRLEPKILEVLVYLAQHPAETVPKEELIRAIWRDTFVSDDVLTRCISELRKALGDDPKAPRVIETIPRKGYRLLEKVERSITVTPEPPPKRKWKWWVAGSVSI